MLYGKSTTRLQTQISIKPIKNRYLVAVNEQGNISTALMGRRGQLYDFNAIDSQDRRCGTVQAANRQARATNATVRAGAKIQMVVSLEGTEVHWSGRNRQQNVAYFFDGSRVADFLTALIGKLLSEVEARRE